MEKLINYNPISETCYWENGNGYRGTKDRSSSGKPCLRWSRLMRELQHTELAGHNFCRNPDNAHAQPWCYVDKQKTVEFCGIPRCSEKMWFFIILGLTIFLIFIICIFSCVCCRKCKKGGVSNIQNISVPNADKNIYGNSRHSSPIEMTSLLTNNGISGMNPTTGRGNVLRIPQYTLQEVRFVEELGEGAFGKGNLNFRKFI
jgi:receptor tyrosine kinase-like orphan receptor 1